MQPISVNSFRRVLAAEVVSNFGSMLTRLVIPWIAALTLGATPFEMGLLLVADVAAGAAGALILGTLIDRLPKRRVMVVSDLLRAVLIGMVALAAWRGWVTLALLVLAQTAGGTLTIAFELARSAWIAQRIPSAQFSTRNAQLAAANRITESASFASGGWFYQWLGGASSLLADALSYLASALCLWRVEEPTRPVASEAGWPSVAEIAAEVRDGIARIAGDATLRMLAMLEILVALCLSLSGTSYMIYVSRDLGFGPGVLGVIFALGGIGAALGAAAAPVIGQRIGSRAAIVRGLALLALGGACVPLAGGATLVGAALLIAHQVIGDGGHVIYEVHDRTLRQSLAPAPALARVDAGLRTVGHITTLIGALGGGAVATLVGARAALFVSAGVAATAALCALLMFVKRAR